MPMTDEEAVRLLRGVRQIVLSGYPFPRDSSMGARICITLGMIAGLTSKAVALHEQGLAEGRVGSMTDQELDETLQELGLDMDSWTKAMEIINGFMGEMREEVRRRRRDKEG